MTEQRRTMRRFVYPIVGVGFPLFGWWSASNYTGPLVLWLGVIAGAGYFGLWLQFEWKIRQGRRVGRSR